MIHTIVDSRGSIWNCDHVVGIYKTEPGGTRLYLITTASFQGRSNEVLLAECYSVEECQELVKSIMMALTCIEPICFNVQTWLKSVRQNFVEDSDEPAEPA